MPNQPVESASQVTDIEFSYIANLLVESSTPLQVTQWRVQLHISCCREFSHITSDPVESSAALQVTQ